MNRLRRILSSVVVLSFFFSTVMLPGAVMLLGRIDLPAPGSMVSLSPGYAPVLMKGIRLHADNPLVFDFIMDTGIPV